MFKLSNQALLRITSWRVCRYFLPRPVVSIVILFLGYLIGCLLRGSPSVAVDGREYGSGLCSTVQMGRQQPTTIGPHTQSPLLPGSVEHMPGK